MNITKLHALPGAIPRYVIYALLVLTPLPRASVQSWSITLIQLATLFALTGFLVDRSLRWDWKWIRTPLDKPIAGLLILCLISYFFSKHRPTAFWSLMLLLNYVVIFYLSIQSNHRRRHIRRLIYLVAIIGGLLAVFGLIKHFGTNPFIWWNYDDISETRYHLISTYGNRNHFAGYLEMAIMLTMGLILTGRFLIPSLLLIGSSIVMSVTLLLTLSRGGWVGGLSGLGYMGYCFFLNRVLSKKKILLAIVTFILFVSLVVLSSTSTVMRIRGIISGQFGSIKGRFEVWKGVVAMIKDYPIVGVGPGNFRTIYTRYHPPSTGSRRHYRAHNDYLEFTSEIGLPLLIIIGWSIFSLYRQGLKKIKSTRRSIRGGTIGALSGITAILVHSFIDFNLQIPANALLFTVLVSIVAAPVFPGKRAHR